MGGYNTYRNRCSVAGLTNLVNALDYQAKIQPIGWSVPNILNKARNSFNCL